MSIEIENQDLQLPCRSHDNDLARHLFVTMSHSSQQPYVYCTTPYVVASKTPHIVPCKASSPTPYISPGQQKAKVVPGSIRLPPDQSKKAAKAVPGSIRPPSNLKTSYASSPKTAKVVQGSVRPPSASQPSKTARMVPASIRPPQQPHQPQPKPSSPPQQQHPYANKQPQQQLQQQQQLPTPFGTWKGSPSNLMLQMTLGTNFHLELRPDGSYKWNNGNPLLTEYGAYQFTSDGGFYVMERNTRLCMGWVVLEYTGNIIVFYNAEYGKVTYQRLSSSTAPAVPAFGGGGGGVNMMNGGGGINPYSSPQFQQQQQFQNNNAFIPQPATTNNNVNSKLETVGKIYEHLNDAGVIEPIGNALGEALAGLFFG